MAQRETVFYFRSLRSISSLAWPSWRTARSLVWTTVSSFLRAKMAFLVHLSLNCELPPQSCVELGWPITRLIKGWKTFFQFVYSDQTRPIIEVWYSAAYDIANRVISSNLVILAVICVAWNMRKLSFSHYILHHLRKLKKTWALIWNFARLLKVTLQTWSAKKILSIRSEIIGEWCRWCQ